jgi:hypothetical protein
MGLVLRVGSTLNMIFSVTYYLQLHNVICINIISHKYGFNYKCEIGSLGIVEH